MLHRSDWKNIQDEAPKALDRYIAHLKEVFGESYRQAAKEREQLRGFFRHQQFEYDITPFGEQWSFELRTPWGRLEKDGWPSRVDAERQALLAAFRELHLLLDFPSGHPGARTGS